MTERQLSATMAGMEEWPQAGPTQQAATLANRSTVPSLRPLLGLFRTSCDTDG
jgi:hypothetical protein